MDTFFIKSLLRYLISLGFSLINQSLHVWVCFCFLLPYFGYFKKYLKHMLGMISSVRCRVVAETSLSLFLMLLLLLMWAVSTGMGLGREAIIIPGTWATKRKIQYWTWFDHSIWNLVFSSSRNVLANDSLWMQEKMIKMDL